MHERLHAAMTALAAGDPLAALAHVSLHEDASSLALRGIALAQIGDLQRAQKLLARAARSFGATQPMARARCVIALAEISLAARELGVSLSVIERALHTLSVGGDEPNALHARLVLSRSLILCGRLVRAAEVLSDVRLRHAPSVLVASTELIRAELALRQLDVHAAQSALERGRRAAEHAGVRALQHELARVADALSAPAARLSTPGETRLLSLLELSQALAKPWWWVDACNRSLRFQAQTLSLVRRPVLFNLLRALAEAWPGGVTRAALMAKAFEVRTPNASHRARLRVELGRLRKLLAGLGSVHAEAEGFRLKVASHVRVAVLAPPSDGEDAQLLALLGDGLPWSSAALALALGVSQRTLQRLLAGLQQKAAVRSIGQGRARRWLAAPMHGMGLSVLGLFQQAEV